MPLFVSLGMGAVVLSAKYGLPSGMASLMRLLILVPLGVLTVAVIAYLLSPVLVKTLLEFCRSALSKTPRAVEPTPSLVASRTS